MTNHQPIDDIPAWLANFADTYIDSNRTLQQGFLDSKLFRSPVVAVYLREISRDDGGTGSVGWVQFEATVQGGEVFEEKRVISPG
jgi:hypothetical protein